MANKTMVPAYKETVTHYRGKLGLYVETVSHSAQYILTIKLQDGKLENFYSEPSEFNSLPLGSQVAYYYGYGRWTGWRVKIMGLAR